MERLPAKPRLRPRDFVVSAADGLCWGVIAMVPVGWSTLPRLDEPGLRNELWPEVPIAAVVLASAVAFTVSWRRQRRRSAWTASAAATVVARPGATSTSAAFLEREVRGVLHALATGPDGVLARVTTIGCDVDEIALQLDDVLHAFLAGFDSALSHRQKAAMLEVQRLFTAMSGEQHAHLWTDDAVRNAPEWRAVMAAAADAERLLDE